MSFKNSKPNKDIIGKIRKGLNIENCTEHLIIEQKHIDMIIITALKKTVVS